MSDPAPHTDRQTWMSLLAKTRPEALAAVWGALDLTPEHALLRGPEIGTVMVQGRAGAVGDGFNLGEMTITRCSVQLGCGTVGHAYVQGRDKDKALQAALVDGLMQTDAAPEVRRVVLQPLAEQAEQRRSKRAAKAAATKVEFFTLMRRED